MHVMVHHCLDNDMSACDAAHDQPDDLLPAVEWLQQTLIVVCSRSRWFVPAYTKEEVRELLSNNLRSRPPDSDTAELTVPRSFSNNV
jgi:hypothetical protein